MAYTTAGGTSERTAAPLTMPRIHVGRAETPSGLLSLLGWLLATLRHVRRLRDGGRRGRDRGEIVAPGPARDLADAAADAQATIALFVAAFGISSVGLSGSTPAPRPSAHAHLSR